MQRVYVGDCAGNGSVGRLWKKWIDSEKDCLRKRGLNVRQAMSKMVGVWEGECMRHSPGDEPILGSCHNYRNPLGGNFFSAPTT